ncbi:DUF5908 family protein [Microbacterium sp. Root180]|uniref:DUF5908 family protein n=1 Tax=Microbacterium sp. Root180 TaxID=1736483 RepID=UPI000A50E514|nr:DUF5908 family protein [Microbacterium sp. Root180]
MAVVIGEIITETVVAPPPEAGAAASVARDEADIDAIVRRATERVLETLRREWDR